MPLMTWGPLQFEVQPFNVHEYDHLTAAEFARKDVAGAAPPREWVGEDDEELYLRGRVYALRIGGMNELDVLEAMRKKAQPQNMVRGDGTSLGWYVLERLVRNHRFLSANGIGQEVQFEGIFVRVPVPRAADYVAGLLDIIA